MAQKYICPVCKAPQERNLRNHLSRLQFLQTLLITLSLMALCYFFFNISAALKASLMFLPVWAAFEFFHWIKIREESKCRVCHFDPMLYRRDWRAARELVEKRMGGLSAQLQEKIQNRIHDLEKATSELRKKREEMKAQALAAKKAPEKSEKIERQKTLS